MNIVSKGGNMESLNDIRQYFQMYEKSRDKFGGLNHLSLGTTELLDILEGDYSSDVKTIAKNIAGTYLKDSIKWINRLFSKKNEYALELQGLNYVESVMDCFDEINGIVDPDNEFNMLKTRVNIRLKKLTDAAKTEHVSRDSFKISKKNIVRQLVTLPKDLREETLILLDKIGLNLRGELEREMSKLRT